MFPPTLIHSQPLPSTFTYSHPLPSTPTPSPTYSHSFAVHSHLFPLFFNPPLSFSAHCHPFPFIFSPLLLILSPFPHMYSLSHPFPVHIQILSPNSTYHLPFQPMFIPVFYVPTCLCPFVFHVPMCLCNSFLCTLLPMSIYFMCFCVC